jgi:hypothetical protein
MLSYKDFKQCINIVSGREVHVVSNLSKDDKHQEELISLNGIWFSIGDSNYSSCWSIVKINYEEDGRYEISKTGNDLCSCIEHMAYCNKWFNSNEN